MRIYSLEILFSKDSALHIHCIWKLLDFVTNKSSVGLNNALIQRVTGSFVRGFDDAASENMSNVFAQENTKKFDVCVGEIFWLWSVLV